MAPDLLQKLRARDSAIRERWETLLRIERVSGPLANPDALVHLIPDSLARVYKALAKRQIHRGPEPTSLTKLPACDCGNNPYLAYFVAGEQAIVESLVLLQAELPPEQRNNEDATDVIRAIRQLAGSEIDAFCGICVHRGTATQCRHALARA